jgi:hypothetical protein
MAKGRHVKQTRGRIAPSIGATLAERRATTRAKRLRLAQAEGNQRAMALERDRTRRDRIQHEIDVVDRKILEAEAAVRALHERRAQLDQEIGGRPAELERQ